jgi:hypothetical protein
MYVSTFFNEADTIFSNYLMSSMICSSSSDFYSVLQLIEKFISPGVIREFDMEPYQTGYGTAVSIQ